MATNREWAEAIVQRIMDEFDPGHHFDSEDAILLETVLIKVFENSPEEMKQLIGTGIIEESYFEGL